MIHNLKIKQEFAIEYYNQNKPWEIRKNDRDFKVNDIIIFTIIETGFIYQRTILYIFQDENFGLQKGYCILTLSKS